MTNNEPWINGTSRCMMQPLGPGRLLFKLKVRVAPSDNEPILGFGPKPSSSPGPESLCQLITTRP
eukprot:CAMPEP_0115346682 /NCGR_PEP_ID=MMETSP0270-20121206/94477_1 /TAXON_ID=71861 /ORGANISM="Scrippsiella trochoidea, Strain CCMP3099" /LENGTH=64 /DNA_ID=CAMNT_0002768553 /DNA_START=50 /DNA_END=240 /DNA_ORIENTATION=-